MNPGITQANIHETICNPTWSTRSIRPPASYTNALKKQQLANLQYKDKVTSHYEEDHLISLELGGHPRDPKNLWPEMWGTPGQPLTSNGPFPPHLIGAKAKDSVENRLHKEVCARTLTLDEAQRIIATDWFKYYRDYVLKYLPALSGSARRRAVLPPDAPIQRVAVGLRGIRRTR